MKEYLIVWMDSDGEEHTKSKTHKKDVLSFVTGLVLDGVLPNDISLYNAEMFTL